MIRMPAMGERFGRYRLVRELGHGGMGVVFLAHDTELDRDVALKIIVPQLAGDADYRARFKRETTALTRMDSPHIVAVHDHGEHDGCLYLVTQLVPHGDLLQQINASGPLAPSAGIDVVLQVLDGLTDAHAAGIVHRDVKPSNVLLRRRDHRYEAFLCDFGVATVPGDHLTRTGALVGSFPYMAPERHQGDPAGVPGDLYSVGCVLWQVLTGTAPYAGTDVEVALAHLQAPIPQLPAGEPFADAVNAVLRTAMAKRPGERYRSAKAMRRDLAITLDVAPDRLVLPAGTQIRHSVLAGVVSTAGSTAPPPAGRRRAGLVAVAASVLVVGLVAAVVAVTSPDDAPAEVSSPAVTTTLSPTASTAPSSSAPAPSSSPPDAQRRRGQRSPPSAAPVPPPATGDPGSPDAPAPSGGAGPRPSSQPSSQPQPTQQPTSDPSPSPEPDDYRCWDGSTSTGPRQCGKPAGVAGLHWMFPKSQQCSRAGARNGRVTVLRCEKRTPYGRAVVSYTEWRGVRAAVGAFGDQFGERGRAWRGGWGYTWSKANKKGASRANLYDEVPMSVKVEAGSARARNHVLERIEYRQPENLRGHPR